MKVTQKYITPSEAIRILQKNTNNRPLRRKHVQDLAEEMKNGRWKTNGDSIRMNGDLLIDGQHRLHACIQSNTGFETLLITDLSSDTFDTIDIGKKRGNADTLHMKGECNSKTLAAALTMLNYYQSGSTGFKTISNIYIQEILKDNPEIRRSVEFVHRRKPMFIARSILATAHYMFAKTDRARADDFIDKVISGVGLDEDSPILLLRERLLFEKSTFSTTSHMMGRFATLMLLIKAWNAIAENRKIKRLTWRRGEKLPKVIKVYR